MSSSNQTPAAASEVPQPSLAVSRKALSSVELADLAIACRRRSISAAPWLDEADCGVWQGDVERRRGRLETYQTGTYVAAFAAGLTLLLFFPAIFLGSLPLLIVSLSVPLVGVGLMAVAENGIGDRIACLEEQSKAAAVAWSSGQGKRASDTDRLWASEQVELAGARGLTSPTQTAALAEQALQAGTVGELYAVLADVCAAPSDEQRDRALERLTDAFADGRISQDELEQRTDQVHEAATRAALDSLIGDL